MSRATLHEPGPLTDVDQTGGAPLVGFTSASEVCNGVHQRSVVLVLFASPHLPVWAGFGRKASPNRSHAVEETAASEPLRELFTLPHDRIWPELTGNGKSLFGMGFSPGATHRSDSYGFELETHHGRLLEKNAAPSEDLTSFPTFTRALFGWRAGQQVHGS